MCRILKVTCHTNQHDNAIDGNVAIAYFGYQPPPLYAMPSLQTLQEIEVPHTTKGQSYTKQEILLFQYILEHPNE